MHELQSGWFLENAWLIPLIPGIAFFLILFIGKKLPMKGSELGLASMAASLVLAAGAAYQWVQRTDAAAGTESAGPVGFVAGFARSIAASEGGHAEPFVAPVIRSWTWWQNDGVELGIGQHIDGLSVMLLLLVTFISLLVQVYSLEYVRGDRRYTHFFAAITLFSAGMLVMVLAENMIQLILGWEIMGVCSFMLIGHWWEEEPNARAALKAFFTVRVGDVGLLVGTSVLFFGANEWTQDHLGVSGFSIEGLQAWALSGDASHLVLLWGAVALFCACIGKSGQFPLHTWLPDAMAGPTPVSSLLHSSTMVVAGVFLVARLYPVFWEGFSIPDSSTNVIVVIAAITIVISGLLAFVQNDIKKVLAYSTVGQLGYMMLGLGAGAWLPAVFHIFTHAFFKCCLFLCAGSVSHSGSHHSFDMKKDMGGLARKMPITCGAWIVAALALAGVFPLAGFFSKDEIIDNVGYNGYTVFMWIALGGAFLTAAYTVRATYLTFFGESRGAAAVGDAHHQAGLGAALSAHDAPHDVQQEGELEADAAHGEAGKVAVLLEEDGAGHGDHGHDEAHPPHESPKLLLIPICILAGLAVLAGFANATPFGEQWENFKEYVEPRPELVSATPGGVAGAETPSSETESGAAGAVPAADEGGDESEGSAEAEAAVGCGLTVPEESAVCYFPAVDHAEFKWSKAAVSLIVVIAGLVSSWFVCVALYTKRNRHLVGLTERFAPARAGYTFLANKYYLDALYEGVIVRGIAHPIAAAAYWINQNVIDGIVNGAGRAGKWLGGFFYKNIDQGLVDGAVKGSGTVANATGHALQPVQSGKVSQYGGLLFGAAAVGAIVLVIINV
ncbi:MAG: NADH-quinone oxidoreductase subunit L [Ilumatobacteraceae bacterium]